MCSEYIAAIDQGTTSTRCILFDHGGSPVYTSQKEHRQHYPRPGWVEHDGTEIWKNTCDVLTEAASFAGSTRIRAIGITNQRETIIVWNKETGEPEGNAIVWQDTRTEQYVRTLIQDPGREFFIEKSGLPPSAYFSATKLKWILDSTPRMRQLAEKGLLLAGTIDSWIVWKLSREGTHVTDVTNASRTMLMNIETCEWDDDLLKIFDIPAKILPKIVPSIPKIPYGYTRANGPLGRETPIAGILGDQQAALFGQACFEPGMCKNTYGTGCFTLMPLGIEPLRSKCGLITTAAYHHEGEDVQYAFEGSVAVAGALVQWLRDNMGLIQTSAEIEELAASVEDNGDVYFVPAFSGLFAPYWRGDARGVITGLTGYASKGHLARAVLEATAFQSWEIVQAMEAESGIPLEILKVDGGMTANNLLMQFQADILGCPVVRPRVAETTALGAAYAAGLSNKFWESREDIKERWQEEARWVSEMDQMKQKRYKDSWKKAVERSYGWV